MTTHQSILGLLSCSVIALESPNEWQANLEPMSPCLFIFNGCGLSGAEKWGWWPRSLLSRPLSFKWPPTSQFLDFFHGSVIALESPNEWQANLEPMSPCLFIFNGCGLSGAEKWGWWPRSLLSRPLSFKWPPTSQFLDFFHGCHCFGISHEWQANLEPMSPCLFIFIGWGLSGAEKWGWLPRSLLSRLGHHPHFSAPLSPHPLKMNWVVLKNEDGGLDPYYYLGHQLQMTTHQSILGLLHGCHCFGISQWMTSQSRTNEPLFVHFNGCGLSGAEKWGCGLDPYYYLGHSASNDHPPVNSWTSFMVLSLLWNLPMNDKSI